MKLSELPKKIPIFPLSNFIIFPKTTVPLNIFEPRYIDMINDAIKSDKFIGMIQPRSAYIKEGVPELYEIGSLGKITSFQETEDGRYLIDLKGQIRFKKVREVETSKSYRILEIDFKKYYEDLNNQKQELKFNDLGLIFKDLKNYEFKRS